MRTLSRLLAPAIVLAASLLPPEAAQAADRGPAPQATASELKAAFLYNFAKFTDWPPDSMRTGQAIALCVAGDSAVATALERIVKGRPIDGHEVVIAAVRLQRNVTACHLLYASGLDAGDAKMLFDAITNLPVLTVGDSDMFVKRGGVVQLILEDDRMRFVVNVRAARRAHLTLSSQLLNRATIVKEGSDVDR